ncbi:MAG: hypothetical protein J6B09_07060 [Clostridia bacterium]|nr:hypothetical protein [Clostridia bacterium]MBQ8716950.1 hypothetical protein [Clostridia bacterium]
MNAYKKYYLMRIGMTTLFGALLGVLFLIARPYAVEVFDVLLIAMGLMTVVLNLPSCLYSLFHLKRRGEWIHLLISAAAIAFGVLLMLIRRDDVLMVLGIFSITLPIVRALLVTEHKKRLKRELPLIFFGVLMVVISLMQVEETVFFICGIAALAISALYLLISLIALRIRLSALAELEQQDKETQQIQPK